METAVSGSKTDDCYVLPLAEFKNHHKNNRLGHKYVFRC